MAIHRCEICGGPIRAQNQIKVCQSNSPCRNEYQRRRLNDLGRQVARAPKAHLIDVGYGRVKIMPRDDEMWSVQVYDGTDFVEVAAAEQKESYRVTHTLREAIRDAILCDRGLKRGRNDYKA